MDTIRFQATNKAADVSGFNAPTQLDRGTPKARTDTGRVPSQLPSSRRFDRSIPVPPRPADLRSPHSHRSPHSMHPHFQPVQVREVRSRKQRNQFVRFPFSIYAGDSNWSPPLFLEVKAFLDRKKHPFYKHGEATQYLAYRDGKVVGRILVSDDPNYNSEHLTNQGCFGMFECIDDQRVANSLLNAAADWLRRRGRTEMMGPIDYSTNYPCGLLIEGFDTPQRVMMNHNPAYYARLFESWRLWKAKDLYAWWFDDSSDMLSQWARRAERLAERGSVKVRPVRLDDFEADVQRCLNVYNESWEKSWGFVKMTEADWFVPAAGEHAAHQDGPHGRAGRAARVPPPRRHRAVHLEGARPRSQQDRLHRRRARLDARRQRTDQPHDRKSRRQEVQDVPDL